MQTPRIRASGKLAGHFKPKQLKLALMGLGTGGSALGTMEEQITNARFRFLRASAYWQLLTRCSVSPTAKYSRDTGRRVHVHFPITRRLALDNTILGGA